MEKVKKLFSVLRDPGKFPESTQGVERHQNYLIFILCGFYCAVAVVFLAFFGIKALIEGRESYGTVLLGFSFVTMAGYVAVWSSGRLPLARHLVAFLMAMLCLYLFFSGGSENPGALWYFIFPPLVIFIQEIRIGLSSVLALMLATLLVYWFAPFDFDPARYSNAFMQRFVAVYVTVTVLSCLFALFKNMAEDNLEAINEKLEIISTTDSLTGLVNRRKMAELLKSEGQRFKRYATPFSVMLLDIDHFKKVNDNYGHPCGDYVLQTIGEICRKSLRNIDTASRWGGEEFLVLLPGTSLDAARTVAERLRTDIDRHEFRCDDQTLSISASLGIAQYRQGASLDQCIQRADQCLYRAKELGRNRTVDESQL